MAQGRSNGGVFFFYLAFFSVFISSVTGQTQIPQWVNPPNSIFQREGTPIGTIIGSLTLQNGHGLMITSENKFVNVTETYRDSGHVVVDIILNTKLDYDSGVTQITCFFKGVNDDVPAGTQVQIPLYVTNVNDETPSLENQPYSVYVPEHQQNMTIGAVVYSITSEDLDSDDSLTFTLTTAVDEYKGKFIINNTTGQIILTGQLDFESVRFYQYTVTVTDEVGHNNSAEIFITIQDMQDTPPYFTGEPFQKNIWENEPLSTSLLKIIASDGDRGVSNDLTFTIISETCKGLFQIEPQSGVISLKANADRDEGDVYSNSGICTLGIQVTEDNHYPQLQGSIWTATTFVTITVMDVNDNVPMFSSVSNYFYVNENAPESEVINLYQPLIVTDNDQESNAHIEVTVTKLKDYFEAIPSRVIQKGEVYIKVKNSSIIDYEKNHSLYIEVEARNATGSNLTQVYIEIININDNSPVFVKQLYVVFVQEAAPLDYFVTKIIATDADEDDEIHSYGRVTYFLEDSDSSFSINSSSGEIFVKNENLDREVKDIYHMTVVAEDGGHRQARTSLEVIIADINDEAPHFVTDTYWTSLAEFNTSFSKPVTVHAVDRDAPNSANSEIVYSIVSTVPSHLDSHFSLDTATGALGLSSALAYDKITFPAGEEGKITLIVAASDRGIPVLSSNASVIIYLQKFSNNEPCDQMLSTPSVPESSFKWSPGLSHKIPVWPNTNPPFITVSETTPVNSVVGSLRLQNGNSLQITSETSYVSLKITNRGADFLEADIILNIKLDYDHGRKQVTLLFTGSNEDFPEGIEFTMVLIVKDVNDESPVLQNRPYSLTIPEDAAVNSEVYMQISAVDSDMDDTLTYALIALDDEKSNQFAVNSYDGVLTLLRNLDFETTTFYHYIIIVQDAAGHTDSADVFITILDVQDMPPFFTWEPFQATVSASTPVGTILLTVKAEDGDRGVSNHVLMSVLSESCPELVRIDPVSGVITLASVVNPSSRDILQGGGVCTLDILAMEDGQHPQVKGNSTATTTVRIYISGVSSTDSDRSS